MIHPDKKGALGWCTSDILNCELFYGCRVRIQHGDHSLPLRPAFRFMVLCAPKDKKLACMGHDTVVSPVTSQECSGHAY